MAGVQMGIGGTLKGKYYITDLHNTDSLETRDVGGVAVMDFNPYAGLNANELTVSWASPCSNGKRTRIDHLDRSHGFLC